MSIPNIHVKEVETKYKIRSRLGDAQIKVKLTQYTGRVSRVADVISKLGILLVFNISAQV